MAATSQPMPPPTTAAGPPPGPSTSRGRKEQPRYRVTGDALPFPAALFVLVATAVSAAFLPRRWADLLALIGLGIAALAADYCITARGRAAAVSIGVCAAYVGIVADGDWLAGWWTPVPLLALGWLTVVIGFRPLLAHAAAVRTLNRDQDARDDALIDDLMARVAGREERAVTEGFLVVWTRILTTWKLPNNSTFLDARRTPRGGRVSIRGPGDSAAVRSSGPTIAARIGVPRDAVQVTGDSQDNSVAHIYINTRDPLADVVPWSPPTGPLNVLKGSRLARMTDGSLMMLPLHETHVRVCGKTRSGKTQTLLMTLADAIVMDNVVLVMIDVAKQGRDYVRFWPHLWMLARTADEAVEALDRVLDEGKARLHRDTLTGVSGTHVPTRADPQYIVIVDEAPTAFSFDGKKGGPDVAGRLLRLALESSGWGCTLVIGITNPHGDVMPTTARRQFGTQVGHAVDDPTAHKLVFDALPIGDLDASKLPLKTGHALIKRNGDQRPALGRVVYADHDALDKWAKSVPARPHVAPHPHLQPPTMPPTDREWAPEPVAAPEPEPEYTGPHLVPDPGPDPSTLTGSDADVYAALVALTARGARPRQADVVKESGRDAKTVRKALVRLITAGYVVEDDAPGSTAKFYRTTRSAA